MNKFISIIIPTYNRKDMLLKCLNSIGEQNFPKLEFEVIIIIDGSTDGTENALKEFKEKSGMDIIFFHQEVRGPGAARNRGAIEAKGGIIAFTEDDIIVDKNWLMNVKKYFENEQADAVEGLTKYQDSRRSIRRFEKQYKTGFLPCNLFIRKNIFDKLGGSDEDFYNKKYEIYFREDSDLGFGFFEAGYKIIQANDVIVFHPLQHNNVPSAYKHAMRYFFDPLLYKKHPDLFRKMIEVKRWFFLTIKRPLHHLCAAGIILFFLTVLSFAFRHSILFTAVFSLLYFTVISVISYKYLYAISVNTFLFVFFPWYYYYWFIKGCIKFKSFGALL